MLKILAAIALPLISFDTPTPSMATRVNKSGLIPTRAKIPKTIAPIPTRNCTPEAALTASWAMLFTVSERI